MRVLHLSDDEITLLAEAATAAVNGRGELRVAIDSDGFKFSLNQGIWTTGKGIVDPELQIEMTCSAGHPVWVSHRTWHDRSAVPCSKDHCSERIDLVHARRHADDPCTATV